MKVILKEGEEALEYFDELINKAVDRTLRRFENRISEMSNGSGKNEELWVALDEAKAILGIRSKKKMQQIRDESPMNGIIISKHGRTFRYLKSSLYEFLESHVVR